MSFYGSARNGQKRETRHEFLQSLWLVCNIRCRHLQERDHPPAPGLCARGRGLEPKVQSSPGHLFLDRAKSRGSANTNPPRAAAAGLGGPKTPIQSWPAILVLHAAHNSSLVLLDGGLVSCRFTATDGDVTGDDSNTTQQRRKLPVLLKSKIYSVCLNQ